MKRFAVVALACMAAPMTMHAQVAKPDPISTTLRQTLEENAKDLVATAQEFPADKYTYHPTPEGMTVGKTMAHIAQVNDFACSKVGGMTAPSVGAQVEETDKDKLIANLQASMDFCKQAFAGLTDAKLAEPVTLFGSRQTSRFAAAMEVTNDLIDHYATLSVYLRLNGLLPPTAQPKK